MATYSEILRRYGVTLTIDRHDASIVSDEPLPGTQARACVRELEAIGVEASDAPDNDDRTVSWLYVVPPVEPDVEQIRHGTFGPIVWHDGETRMATQYDLRTLPVGPDLTEAEEASVPEED